MRSHITSEKGESRAEGIGLASEALRDMAEVGAEITDEAEPIVLRKLGSRFVPFTQALFAGSHFSTSPPGISGGGTQFVFGLGGGSNLLLGRSGKFALRGQVEYFGIRANGGTTPTVRLGASIVHRIGKNSVTGR